MNVSTKHRRFTHVFVIILLVAVGFPLGVSSMQGRLGQLFYRDPVPGNNVEAGDEQRRAEGQRDVQEQRRTGAHRAVKDRMAGTTGWQVDSSAVEPQKPLPYGHPLDAYEEQRKKAAAAGSSLGKEVPFTPAYAAYLTQDSSVVDRLIAYAYGFMGTPYRFGGKGPEYFDCAGFTRHVFLPFGVNLGTGCSTQINQGTRIRDTRKLQRGDLVFFGDQYLFHLVGHVGLVTAVDSSTGAFSFIHASTSAGVVVSSSREPYYVQRYIGACRVLPMADQLPSPASHAEK